MTKTVLITGCSTGFGKLAAKTFQAKGWNVVATMRTPEKETELSTSDTMLVTRLDVTDQASIKSAIDEGLAKFGGLDVVVNNAGYGSNAMFEQSPDASIRAMYETNVFGVMNVMREALPHLRARGEGRVINVTSMAGLIGLPGNSVYSSSKFAVEGLTEGLSMEYRDLGVQLKTVAPGAFMTTAFMDNIESRVSEGDDQLRDHSLKMREHFTNLAQGGGTQDPQMVADKIFECATQDTPVHNPVGADADGLYQMMNGMDDREAFINVIASRFLPPAG
jgi:NAD(P)-dependent dehydrogenase (short-subunit alcohol dehydrogenase family)